MVTTDSRNKCFFDKKCDFNGEEQLAIMVNCDEPNSRHECVVFVFVDMMLERKRVLNSEGMKLKSYFF